jgi:hypothetical protein
LFVNTTDNNIHYQHHCSASTVQFAASKLISASY